MIVGREGAGHASHGSRHRRRLRHVLNRAKGRLGLFRKKADFRAFEAIVAEAHQRVPLRILGYVYQGQNRRGCRGGTGWLA